MRLFSLFLVLAMGAMPFGAASAMIMQTMNEEEVTYFDCVQSVLMADRTAKAVLSRYLTTREMKGFQRYSVPSGAKFLWQAVYDKSIAPTCGSASRHFVKFGCLPQPVDDGADAAAMQTIHAGIRPMTFRASAK